MAIESKLQKKIRINLEKDGWYVVKISICNKPGFPDLMPLRNKKVYFMEIKSKGKKAEPLQIHRHQELQAQGFTTFIIDTWEQYLQIKYLL